MGKSCSSRGNGIFKGLESDGGGQHRDIGAGQDKMGTDLKAIPPALALLLSET